MKRDEAVATLVGLQLLTLGLMAPAYSLAEVKPQSYTTVCPSGQTLPGTDVSDYDSGTQWDAVAQSGQVFVFIKATEGETFVNPLFDGDWANAGTVGILRGAYHFYHPGDDPVAQAQFFLQTLGGVDSAELPPVFDWEVSDGVDTDTQIENALTWLQTVEAATGKVPLVYTNYKFFDALGNPQQFARYPLYVADYDVDCPKVPQPWTNWVLWQPSGSGTIPGLKPGQADIDEFNGTLYQLQSLP
jgi:lysozyme